MTEEQVTEVCLAVREILGEITTRVDRVEAPFCEPARIANSIEAGNAPG
jgi:hypothetical protein